MSGGSPDADPASGEPPPGLEPSLARAVLARLDELGHTLAVAESCTGGLLGAAVTAVPGSSTVFLGGIVAYHDAVKRELLGVPERDLRAAGAVSEPVARRMAEGARRRLGSTWAAAVTGIAGPGGGSPGKPVGTVWIAVDGPAARAERFHFPGDREEVRRRSVRAALEMLRVAAHDGRTAPGGDGPTKTGGEPPTAPGADPPAVG